MTQAAVSAGTSSFRKRALRWLLAALACVAGGVYATNYTLWIHGRNGGGAVGNHLDFTYWGPDSANAGVNKRSINWDGFSRISASNGVIRDALDCYCTGSNWCYIAAHSAGDNQIGYALSLYGGTARPVKNPDASCTGTGGTQTGWNIKWVGVAGGSGGGTELANYGAWAVADPLTSDLKTSTARDVRPQPDARRVVLHVCGRQGSFVLVPASGAGRRGGRLPLLRRCGGQRWRELLQSFGLVLQLSVPACRSQRERQLEVELPLRLVPR
jgi:hypothetical protein